MLHAGDPVFLVIYRIAGRFRVAEDQRIENVDGSAGRPRTIVSETPLGTGPPSCGRRRNACRVHANVTLSGLPLQSRSRRSATAEPPPATRTPTPWRPAGLRPDLRRQRARRTRPPPWSTNPPYETSRTSPDCRSTNRSEPSARSTRRMLAPSVAARLGVEVVAAVLAGEQPPPLGPAFDPAVASFHPTFLTRLACPSL
jgi:hypothetical protein